MNSILLSFRQFHNYRQVDVAQRIELSLDEYKKLELGLQNIDSEVAMRLSKFFKAPAHIFLSFASNTNFSIVYSQCNFQNSNGYVNHLYNENEVVIKAKDEIIALLKEEVRKLRMENEKLLTKLING